MTTFSKKHYEALADVARDYNTHFEIDIREFIENLCVMFERDNPKFNKEKFLVACGYTK